MSKIYHCGAYKENKVSQNPLLHATFEAIVCKLHFQELTRYPGWAVQSSASVKGLSGSRSEQASLTRHEPMHFSAWGRKAKWSPHGSKVVSKLTDHISCLELKLGSALPFLKILKNRNPSRSQCWVSWILNWPSFLSFSSSYNERCSLSFKQRNWVQLIANNVRWERWEPISSVRWEPWTQHEPNLKLNSFI